MSKGNHIYIQFKINDSKYCTLNNNGCLEIKENLKSDNISLKYFENHIFHNTETRIIKKVKNYF